MSTNIAGGTGVNKLSLPAIVIVALVTQVPLLFTLILSFIKWNVVRPDLGRTFVALDNYARLLGSGEFYVVVWNTFLMTVTSLALCTLLGIIFGLMLNRNFFGVNIVRTMVIAPFFVMEAVAGIIWRTLMLNSSFGINAYLTALFGIQPIDFLGAHALMTVIMLIVWQWTPFFVLIILAGFQSISDEILDSAQVDGASWFQTLLFIRIPAIMHHIEVAILLGLIFIFKVFGLIFVTTSGGPGTASSNLPYFVYKRAFLGWSVGEAASIAVLTVFITLAAIMVLFKWFQRRFAEVQT